MRYLILFLFFFSCTKVVYQVVDKSVMDLSKNFDNDTDLIQYLLDNNLVVNLESRDYLIDRTIYLTKYFQQIRGGGATQLIYSGTGPAISFKRANNDNFPVMCQVRDISIILKNDNSIGMQIMASHSTFDNISVGMLGNNNIGFKIMGDKNGTGSYYNIFTKCSVQGSVQTGKKNQIGIDLSYEESAPNRCPNANLFYGGRIGQVNKGIVIRGGGNTFYSPVFEGVTEKCFEFDHPSSPVGCVENNVYSPYIEGADGVQVGYFGKNAIGCHVINPFITSIGVKGMVEKIESTIKTNSVYSH